MSQTHNALYQYSSLTQEEKLAIVESVNNYLEFRNYGIAYIGFNKSEIFKQPSQSPKRWIIIYEIGNNVDNRSIFDSNPQSKKKANTKNLIEELVGLGLNCGSAVISGVAVFGGAAGTTVSAGTSIGITIVAWGTFSVSSLQCVDSIGRVINELGDPDKNDYLDSLAWYKWTSNVLEVISLISGFKGISSGLKQFIKINKAAGRPLWKVTKGLNRGQRKTITRNLSTYKGQYIKSNKKYKALVRANKLPKRLSQKQINKIIYQKLTESISNSLSVVQSGRAGVVRNFATVFLHEEK